MYVLNEAVVSFEFEQGYDYHPMFSDIYVDDVCVMSANWEPWSQYKMNLGKYFDGYIHKLELTGGQETGICYFSSYERFCEVDGVKYLTFDNTNEAHVVGCTKDIEDVVIHSNLSNNCNNYQVTQVLYQAFQNCKTVKTINIPETITSIQQEAFYGCSSLNHIVLPSSLSKICSKVFYNCISLQSIEVPASITSIESEAFFGCLSLSDLVLKPTSRIDIAHNILNKYVRTPNGEIIKNGHSLSKVTLIENFGSWMNELLGSTIVYTLPFKYDEAKEVRGNNEWKIDLLPDIKITESQPYLDRFVFKIENMINANIQYVRFNNTEIKPSDSQVYSINGLKPATNYTFQISYIHPDWGYLSKDNSFLTQSVNVNIALENITHSTATFKVAKTQDSRVSTPVLILKEKEYKVNNDGSIKLSELYSNYQYDIRAKVIFNDENYFSNSLKFQTKKVTPTIENKTLSSTTIAIRPEIQDKGDAIISSENFMVNNSNQPIEAFHRANLPLNSSFTARYSVNNEQVEETFTLPQLELKTMAARAASKDCAIICAETNMSEEEYGGGFEWRRYDAPDMVPSTFSPCPVANGHMEGRLRGLSMNTYYKYRPYYEDCNGARTFGEWTAFITADADVYFEPTVYTYAPNTITQNSATVVGYAIGGSEDVDEQGFEYWAVSQSRATTDVRRVLATGQRMTATLDDLEPGTRYTVRAFATTKTKTTYGENQAFETDGLPSAIEPVIVEETEIQPFDIYTLNGICVRRHTTDLSGLAPGLYIANGKKIVVH